MADGDQRDQAYAKATRGILFFGVPSQGMDISSLRTLVRGQPNEFLISNLREDSDVLRRQTRDFRQKFPHESCRIISFYETGKSFRSSPDALKLENDCFSGSILTNLLLLYSGSAWIGDDRRTYSVGHPGLSDMWIASSGERVKVYTTDRAKSL